MLNQVVKNTINTLQPYKVADSDGTVHQQLDSVTKELLRSAVMREPGIDLLGLRRKRKKWTHEEVEYLKESWGTVSVKTIAKNLNRPISSIENKAHMLSLGPTKDAAGNLTLSELARAVGVSPPTVKKWVEKYGLRHSLKATRIKRKFYQINIEDFWTWLEQNQDKVHTHFFEKGILGKEPDWMKEKRKKDSTVPPKNKHWKSEEDDFLRKLLQSQLTYKQISNIMGKSVKSIRNRIRRISI